MYTINAKAVRSSRGTLIGTALIREVDIPEKPVAMSYDPAGFLQTLIPMFSSGVTLLIVTSLLIYSFMALLQLLLHPMFPNVENLSLDRLCGPLQPVAWIFSLGFLRAFHVDVNLFKTFTGSLLPQFSNISILDLTYPPGALLSWLMSFENRVSEKTLRHTPSYHLSLLTAYLLGLDASGTLVYRKILPLTDVQGIAAIK
ncbi:hypothetical protein DFH09DRAFT_1077105 [Mycena vulgaris]|nr:hypothetical protein DFH09DRAFT_1077105 [Mycena vulgaris]